MDRMFHFLSDPTRPFLSFKPPLDILSHTHWQQIQTRACTDHTLIVILAVRLVGRATSAGQGTKEEIASYGDLAKEVVFEK